MDAPHTIKNVNPNSKKQNTKFAENNTAKKNKYYKVRTGDTLTKIAKQHNISTSSLEAHNHLQHNKPCLRRNSNKKFSQQRCIQYYHGLQFPEWLEHGNFAFELSR